MDKIFYSIDFNSRHIAYAIKVNDILLEHNQHHVIPRNTIKTNQWMYNGRNTYEIILSVNPTWEKSLEDSNFRFKITEHKGTNGNYNPNEVLTQEWYYREGEQFPVVITGEYTLDIPYGNWIWRDADIIDEEKLDTESLKEYLSLFHKSLNEKNVSQLEQYLKIKSTELAQAYYIELEERFKDQKEFFTEELFCNPSWGMKDLDLHNLFFRYHADNRLLEVIDKNGESPLQSVSLDGYTFSIKLYLCHKNNQWVLCR